MHRCSRTDYNSDDNGNLTDDGTYEYYYDCENRLIDVNENGTNVASYKYDYMGRRVKKTDYTLSPVRYMLPASLTSFLPFDFLLTSRAFVPFYG